MAPLPICRGILCFGQTGKAKSASAPRPRSIPYCKPKGCSMVAWFEIGGRSGDLKPLGPQRKKMMLLGFWWYHLLVSNLGPLHPQMGGRRCGVKGNFVRKAAVQANRSERRLGAQTTRCSSSTSPSPLELGLYTCRQRGPKALLKALIAPFIVLFFGAPRAF